jgi:hypothetical protein
MFQKRQRGDGVERAQLYTAGKSCYVTGSNVDLFREFGDRTEQLWRNLDADQARLRTEEAVKLEKTPSVRRTEVKQSRSTHGRQIPLQGLCHQSGADSIAEPGLRLSNAIDRVGRAQDARRHSDGSAIRGQESGEASGRRLRRCAVLGANSNLAGEMLSQHLLR